MSSGRRHPVIARSPAIALFTFFFLITTHFEAVHACGSQCLASGGSPGEPNTWARRPAQVSRRAGSAVNTGLVYEGWVVDA